MVWESPLDGTAAVYESSSSSSSSPAEVWVREIASKLGLDSKILAAVCQRMRKEYVLEEWQLPNLDSRQWEQLNAPIGLAAAVRHISAHRIRARENPFPQDDDNNYYYLGRGEEKEQDAYDNDDIAQTASGKVDMSSPSKPEKASGEIDEPSISNTSYGVVEANLQRTYIVPSGSTDKDAEPIEHQTETAEGKMKIKNEQEDERISLHIGMDQSPKKSGFIEECTDWLKLMITPSQDDEETDVNGKVDAKGNGDHTGVENKDQSDVTEAIRELASFSDDGELVQVSSESKSAPVIIDEEKQGNEISERVFDKRIERDFNSIFRAKNVQMRADTETSNGKKQESSTPFEEDEEEDQQILQQGTNSIESIAIESKRKSKADTSGVVDNDTECEKDGEMNIDHEIEKPFAKTLEAAKKGKLDNTGSDSDVEDNTNIFSGIPNSASFSEDEDEDDQGPLDKENALEDTEGAAISGISDNETSMLLYPENWADDITVAMSNVSAECREKVSKRKKKMKQYIHEYDKGKQHASTKSKSLQTILLP